MSKKKNEAATIKEAFRPNNIKNRRDNWIEQRKTQQHLKETCTDDLSFPDEFQRNILKQTEQLHLQANDYKQAALRFKKDPSYIIPIYDKTNHKLNVPPPIFAKRSITAPAPHHEQTLLFAFAYQDNTFKPKTQIQYEGVVAPKKESTKTYVPGPSLEWLEAKINKYNNPNMSANQRILKMDEHKRQGKQLYPDAFQTREAAYRHYSLFQEEKQQQTKKEIYINIGQVIAHQDELFVLGCTPWYESVALRILKFQPFFRVNYPALLQAREKHLGEIIQPILPIQGLSNLVVAYSDYGPEAFCFALTQHFQKLNYEPLEKYNHEWQEFEAQTKRIRQSHRGGRGGGVHQQQQNPYQYQHQCKKRPILPIPIYPIKVGFRRSTPHVTTPNLPFLQFYFYNGPALQKAREKFVDQTCLDSFLKRFLSFSSAIKWELQMYHDQLNLTQMFFEACNIKYYEWLKVPVDVVQWVKPAAWTEIAKLEKRDDELRLMNDFQQKTHDQASRVTGYRLYPPHFYANKQQERYSAPPPSQDVVLEKDEKYDPKVYGEFPRMKTLMEGAIKISDLPDSCMADCPIAIPPLAFMDGEMYCKAICDQYRGNEAADAPELITDLISHDDPLCETLSETLCDEQKDEKKEKEPEEEEEREAGGGGGGGGGDEDEHMEHENDLDDEENEENQDGAADPAEMFVKRTYPHREQLKNQFTSSSPKKKVNLDIFPFASRIGDRGFMLVTHFRLNHQKQPFLKVAHLLGTYDFNHHEINKDYRWRFYCWDDTDEGEKLMLEHWTGMLRHFDNEWICGYNSLLFDVPYLVKRAQMLGSFRVMRDLSRCVTLPEWRHNTRLYKRYYESNVHENREARNRSSMLDMPQVHLPGMIQYDVLIVIRAIEARLERYTLSEVAKKLLEGRVNKKELPGQMISPFFASTKKHRGQILVYCEYDVRVLDTLVVDKMLTNTTIQISTANNVSIMEQILQGQQIKSWNMVCRWSNNMGFILDERIRKIVQHMYNVPRFEFLPKILRYRDRPGPMSLLGVLEALIAKFPDNYGKLKQDIEDRNKLYRGEILPKKPGKGAKGDKLGYDGAVVLKPVVGVHDDPAVSTLDFASLYPSILEAYNLCFTTWVRHQFNPQTGEIEFPGLEAFEITVIRPCDPMPDKSIFKENQLLILRVDDAEPIPPKKKAKSKRDADKTRVLRESGIPSIKQFFSSASSSTSASSSASSSSSATREGTVNTMCFVQNRPGLLPALLNYLVGQRKKVKNLMEQAIAAGDKALAQVYNAQQNAIKVICNSVYGFLGAQHGYFGFVPVARAITCIGRHKILHVERVVYHMGGEVLYGDTDSVFIKFKKLDPANFKTVREYYEACMAEAKKICDAVNDNIIMPSPMKLEYEKVFWSIVFFKPKTYAGVKIDGDALKGLFAHFHGFSGYCKKEEIPLRPHATTRPHIQPKYKINEKVPFKEALRVGKIVGNGSKFSASKCEITDEEFAFLLSMDGTTRDRMPIKKLSKGTGDNRRDKTPWGRDFIARILELIQVTDFRNQNHAFKENLFLGTAKQFLDKMCTFDNLSYEPFLKSIARKADKEYKGEKQAQKLLFDLIQTRTQTEIQAGTRIYYLIKCPTDAKGRPRLFDAKKKKDKLRDLWDEGDFVMQNKLMLYIPNYIDTQIIQPALSYLVPTKMLSIQSLETLRTLYTNKFEAFVERGQHQQGLF